MAASQLPAAAPLSPWQAQARLTFDARIEIIVGGALGTGTFRYSLDTFTGDVASERTYSAVQTIPSGGTFAIPNTGITVTFASGTYVATESYTWTSNCGAANSTDLGNALDALDATALGWRFAYLVTSNNTGDSTAHAVLAAAFQTRLNTMASASKYRRGIMASDFDDIDPTSDYTSLEAKRLLINHGRFRAVSTKPFVGHAFPVAPGATVQAAQAAASLISTDLKRVASGSLPNIERLFVDERVDATGLDDIKISTLRTYQGRSGFYITQGRLKSADGSDFTVWPRGIVMDVACETAHEKHLEFIGMGVRVNDGGTIDERDALRLEEQVQALLDARLLSPRNAEGQDGHVSDVKYSISRTNNVLATSTIEAEVAIKPLGYIDYITANTIIRRLNWHGRGSVNNDSKLS